MRHRSDHGFVIVLVVVFCIFSYRLCGCVCVCGCVFVLLFPRFHMELFLVAEHITACVNLYFLDSPICGHLDFIVVTLGNVDRKIGLH